jgi:hypothetical protein
MSEWLFIDHDWNWKISFFTRFSHAFVRCSYWMMDCQGRKLWANWRQGIIGRLTLRNIGKTMYARIQIMPTLLYWVADVSPGGCHQQILVIKVCIKVHINVLVQVGRDINKLSEKVYLACTTNRKTWRGWPRHKNASKIGIHRQCARLILPPLSTRHFIVEAFQEKLSRVVHYSLIQKSHLIRFAKKVCSCFLTGVKFKQPLTKFCFCTISCFAR